MNTFKIITTVVATLIANTALADGFRCLNEDGRLKVTVYNQIHPELGTRSAAVMVLSNPTVSEGRKTIARFTSANGVLASESLVYTADVDLRFSDSSRSGELVGDTKLGELDTVHLVVEHNYLQPVEDGDLLGGYLVLKKRSGDDIIHDMICTRYLKN